MTFKIIEPLVRLPTELRLLKELCTGLLVGLREFCDLQELLFVLDFCLDFVNCVVFRDFTSY